LSKSGDLRLMMAYLVVYCYEFKMTEVGYIVRKPLLFFKS